MESQRNDGSVILSYEVPISKWIGAGVLMRLPLVVGLISVGLLVRYLVQHGFISSTSGWIIDVIAFLAILFARRRGLVIGLVCTTSGLEISTLSARKVRHVGWCQIKELRRGVFRFHRGVFLMMQSGEAYNLRLVPREVLERLALIMREASNARVAGFDGGV